MDRTRFNGLAVSRVGELFLEGRKRGLPRRHLGIRVALGACAVLLSFSVSAQFSEIDPGGPGSGGAAAIGVAPFQEYRKRIESIQNIAPLDYGLFGEQVSLYNGATSFAVTDIDIPGNNALRVQLSRRHAVEVQPQGTFPYDARLGGAGNWDVDAPYIAATYPQSEGWKDARCTTGSVPSISYLGFHRSEVWQGLTIHVPGRGDTSALGLDAQVPKPTDGGLYRLSTSERDLLDCIPMKSGLAGEGFRMTTASGVRYHFDVGVIRSAATLERYVPDSYGIPRSWRVARDRFYLLASKVEDRFGNYVQYQYNASGHPVKISSSDGREITFSYVGGRLSSATSHGKVWQFQYETVGGEYRLHAVTRPDSSRWEYAYSGSLKVPVSTIDTTPMTAYCHSVPPPTDIQYTIQATHPSGAEGLFTFRNRRHFRSGVHATECVRVGLGASTEYKLQVPHFSDVLSLTSKNIAGSGLVTPSHWSYDYGASFQTLWGSYSESPSYPCTTCSIDKTVTVTNPDSSRLRYRFGVLYMLNDGRQLQVETLQPDETVIRSEVSDYLAEPLVAQQPFYGNYGVVLGGVSDPTTARVRPIVKRTIRQDGKYFVWRADQFDTKARPVATTSYSESGSQKKESVTYYDNTVRWVLGQVESVRCTASVPANVACDGDVVSQTTYSSYAQPLTIRSFGKLQQTLTHDVTTAGQMGTVKTVKDGVGNLTTLSSWHRGIPRSIKYADNTTQSAAVNPDGTIASVTDENGFVTGYQYDAMGRLTLTDYPDGDTVPWTSTARTFSFVSGVYGLPNHWRMWERTGTGYKLTHYDAMWRPVVTETYVSTDATNTRSIVVNRYDEVGRLAFQSYPVRSLGLWTDAALKGTRTTYDSLGRVTKVTQDSELGALATTTAYLNNANGPYIKVTNARGQITYTWFQAFDQPSYDTPVTIWHPAGARTHITRDTFGKPTRLRRSNSSSKTGGTIALNRDYFYNGYQELCRISEPETGDTFMGYDAAGNLAWSAAGYNSTATGCLSASSVAARRVDRSYDARNRPVELRFPDGLGDTVTSYTPDGLPASITAYNGSNVVTTSTTYNRRRLPTQERMQWGSIDWALTHTYNTNGHLAADGYPGALIVSYTPNGLGQPTQAGSYVTGVSYHPNGAIRQFTYGNGIVHTLDQNERGLPDRSLDAYGATKYLDDGYDYDANGNVAGISDGATGRNQRGNRTMTYDGLDRLISTTSPMFGTATYAYDVLDNLTQVKVGGTKQRDHYYCHDANWRLTNVKTGGCGGTTVIGLGYDEQGNLKDKNGGLFTFDYGNRLRSSTAGGTISYVYDGHGRRVRDFVSGQGSKYSLYSQAGSLMFDSDLRKKQQHQYIYMGGSLVATREKSTVTGAYSNRYQHTDALGSPVVVTSQARGVLERTEYEPFGQVLNRPLKDGPGYTGHVEDVRTGLSYMQQRYYDPGIGRFLSVDPVTAFGGDMRHFNRYAYTYNNPYRFTDPDGRCPDACVVEGGVVIGAGVVYVTAGALITIGACAAACDKIQRGIEGAAERLRNFVQNATADSPASAGEKVREGTKPAAGDSGAKGEREGAGGDKGRNEAWGKIEGKETSPKDGVRVKELSGGGRAETHDSTKSRDYPQGTPTIKVQDDKGKVETTVRYPKDL